LVSWLNPTTCNIKKRTPKKKLASKKLRYFSTSLFLKLFKANTRVILLSIIIPVVNQKISGNSNVAQFAWFLFTMYALVNPANIIMILPIAIHNVNLCG
jgi:hypothetical protein